MRFNKAMNRNSKFRINSRNFLPSWGIVSFTQLFDMGVQIGHSIANTTPYAAWMVWGERQGLSLINLFKFIYMLRAGLFIIQGIIKRRSPIWFVNLDGTSKAILITASTDCGEYYVCDNWINGMLSNFYKLKNAGFKALSTKRILFKQIHTKFYKNYSRWAWTRNTWPRAVFVSNVLKSYNVCHEAMCLKIATLGIVDTNSPQKYVNLAIPGNDESFTTLVYYNNLIALFVLYNKFTLVYSWYINRVTKLSKNFKQWIKNKCIYVKKRKIKPNIAGYKFTNSKNLYAFNLVFYQDLFKQQELFKTQKINHINRNFIDNTKIKIKLVNYFSSNKKFFIGLNKLLSLDYGLINLVKRKAWWDKYKKKIAPRKNLSSILFNKRLITKRKNTVKINRHLLSFKRRNIKKLFKNRLKFKRFHYKEFYRWILKSTSKWAKIKLTTYYRMYSLLYMTAALKYNLQFSKNYFRPFKADYLNISPNWYTEIRKNAVAKLNLVIGNKLANKIVLSNLNKTGILYKKYNLQAIKIQFSKKIIRKLFIKRKINRFNSRKCNKQSQYLLKMNRKLLSTNLVKFYTATTNINLFKTRIYNNKLYKIKKLQYKLSKINKI